MSTMSDPAVHKFVISIIKLILLKIDLQNG